MKKGVSVLLLISAVVVGLYLWFNPAKNPAPTTEEPPATTSFPQQTSARPSNPANGSSVGPAGINSSSSRATQSNLADQAGVVAPAVANADNIPPAIAVENVSRAVRQYGVMFGGNPVGTNPEITAALNGGNPKQINFINPDAGMRINEKGELMDAWGKPLFFHQISGTETEIRSAGPDKIMWTHDDLVAQ